MKILQICNFSSGISGVWTRVLEDSRNFFKKGYEVHVFSSDIKEDGTKEIVFQAITKEGINITRFPIKRKMGYAIWFDFEKEAVALNPNIIICHGLRKPYLGKALKIARRVGAKCFLITHAPFIEKELREKKLNLSIWLYDKFLGKNVMNSFDKVIAICKWEIPILEKLGCYPERIEYIPNSLSEEFFINEPKQEENKIIYLGRMHPVKEIEILIKAFKNSNLQDYTLEIISSKEGEYFQSLINFKNGENIIFTEPIYEINKKIEKIDYGKIFVLPSKKESLPFGIIEAMARGKIVVATKTKGGIEIIKDGENGFLFDIGDSQQLQILLEKISNMNDEEQNKIKENAKKTGGEYRIVNIMNKWEKLFNEK